MLLWDSPLMDTSSRCSRERGAGPQLHQEARVLDSKRRSKEEEEEKLITGRRKENTDPGEGLHQTRKIQNLYKDYRWYLQNSTRTRYAAGAGFRSGHELQSCRPEIRLALIRKTRIQNSFQIKDKNNVIDFVPKDQTDAGSTETNMDQNKETRTSSKFSETRTSRSSDRRAGGLQETISRSETRPRTRRRKVHQSAFRGRGQLRLSITPEAGQLIIHIHEARGLMGKSCRSCDSYVKLSVTSDLHDSIGIKTQTVRNNKNPAYQQNFSLCVSEPLLLSRLLVSVLRRLPKPRCSQLIGCMSFGIGSLSHSSQLIAGWFYLLGEEFGRSKHMRVTSQSYRPIKSLQVTVERQEVESTADLRRTPDSAPDPDLIHTSTLTRTKQSVSTITTSSGPNVSTQHSMGSGGLSSLDSDDANYSSYVTSQHLAINIIRGKDGFGFTICSDCPVRVQAVDPGGPAHQSGLCQGDLVLQLNGLPVETWKCADLAQAIRSCPSQLVLVVWRGLPELSSAGETLLRPQVHNALTTTKLLSHPAHSKYSRRWSQGRGLRSGRGFLGSLWRDRKEDQDQEETKDKQMFSTIKSTRATSSNGDNYIILSPINPEGELPQQIYHDRNGTIGRLYQTHPSRGQNLLHNTRAGMSQQSITSHTSTLPVSQPRTMALDPPGNPGNYQNCTIVQSHLPRSGYGNYASLPPKTLIFPIFVQSLDLCSSDRTLCMSEEMILHQTDLLPSKVTVLIYSDLMLITRKDEAGRCNVLQSPLYLNMLQLREVPSEPLHIYFLQDSDSSWCCLFSLEAFSIEQKVRISLCLHDNKQNRQVTMENPLPYQFSDLPSDFGRRSLSQSNILCDPSSPYSCLSDPCRPSSPSLYSHRPPLSSSSMSPPPPFTSIFPFSSSSPPPRIVSSLPQYISPPPSFSSTLRSPVWKQRDDTEEERRKRRQVEEEERQQGEGESSSETSESIGRFGTRGLLLSPHHFNMNDEEVMESEEDGDEEEFSCRPVVLRRSLSEGSLVKEPRSPRFLSDSTIHRLTRTSTFDLTLTLGTSPCPPSPQTLRKQLTKEGASLHQMLMLLNGSKGGTSSNCKLKKKKTKSLAADIQSRLAFLRRRKNYAGIHGNSLEKALKNNRPSEGEVKRWAESLEALLTHQYGVAVFRHFLRSEFSEENLDFWLAVEEFKRTLSFSKMADQAKKIYDEFISTSAARQVNVDSFVRDSTNQSLIFNVNTTSFQLAQDQIFSLMEADSYPRFLKSRLYAQLANHSTATALELSNQSRSVS